MKLTKQETKNFAFSFAWASSISAIIVGGLVASGILTGGISLYVTGVIIAAAMGVARTCSWLNKSLILTWYVWTTGVPQMWCGG